MKNNTNIVTRFAPSPTGFMHVGGVRTALFAYLWARKNNGTFILRIEDTDKEREVAGSIEHIIESLTWLGLEYDFGPQKPGTFGSCIQSERLPLYLQYAQKLIDKGYAYADPYTEEELDVFRKKADEEKRPFLFRDHRPETEILWDGTRPLRFKVPTLKRYTWTDIVWGELSFDEGALDDFILIKSDGYPTYNFAHIVDDIEMGVTHVMRGQEFISSTPKFLSLYEALEIEPPVFATLPPIMAPDGKKKLGKRDGAKDLLEYKKEGYEATALVNFLALLGWNPGNDKELFYSMKELEEEFELSKIQHSGAQLNEEKLLWMNKEHIRNLDLKEQKEKVRMWLPEEIKNLPEFTEQRLDTIISIIIDRIGVWSDIGTLAQEGEIGYFFIQPNLSKEMLSWKGESLDNAKKHLEHVREILAQAPESAFSSSEGTKGLIWEYAEAQGRGSVLWPLRVSLSGREKSPDPFTLLSIFGKEESIKRLHTAINIL